MLAAAVEVNLEEDEVVGTLLEDVVERTELEEVLELELELEVELVVEIRSVVIGADPPKLMV